MANPVVHFEIPADNLQRAQAFYQKSFGWKINPWKNDKMEYWSVLTKDAKGNGINGGMMPRKMPGQPLTIYMMVPSVEAALAAVVANGGKVALPKQEIGENMGAIGCFIDTEGNIVGVHEMGTPAKTTKKTAKKPVKKAAAKKKK